MKIFLIIAIFLLGIRFHFFYENQPQLHHGQQVNITTTLLSEPKIFSRYQRITANEGVQKIRIFAPLYPSFHYGDKLLISGKISQGKESKGNVFWRLYFPKIEQQKVSGVFFYPLAVAGFIRQKAADLFMNTLPFDSANLLLGIVFGIKAQMTKDFSDALRISGVLHVIAASGMNVTMTAGFLVNFFLIFLKRQYALGATITGIWLYTLIAGLEASILRASIMATMLFVAQITGRQYLAGYGVLLAALIMVLVNPTILADIGFQLSFGATIGLLYLVPVLKGLLGRTEKLGRLIGENLMVTLAAQIATLPLLLIHFGSYSLWSILVNALVLWTIPPLMVLGAVATLVGIVFFPLGKLILFLTLPFLMYFESIVYYFSHLGGVVQFTDFPLAFLVGYYLFLLALFFGLKTHAAK